MINLEVAILAPIGHPGSPKDIPRPSQDAWKIPQDPPRPRQDGPKTLQETQRGPLEGASGLQN